MPTLCVVPTGQKPSLCLSKWVQNNCFVLESNRTSVLVFAEFSGYFLSALLQESSTALHGALRRGRTLEYCTGPQTSASSVNHHPPHPGAQRCSWQTSSISVVWVERAFKRLFFSFFGRGKAGFSVVTRLTCETLKVPSPEWYRDERGLCEHDTNVWKVIHIVNKHLILKAKFLNKRKEGAYFASAWEDCLVLFLGTKVNFINELSRDPGPSMPYSVCNMQPQILGGGARGFGVQGHPQLHKILGPFLPTLKPCLNQK